MARHFEIERKFLVPHPPAGWRRRSSSVIVQGYLSHPTKHVEVRLRRRGARYFVTIKGGYGLRRIEEEIAITKPTFNSLWPLTHAARIAKRRYLIPHGRHTIELDVYQGPHRGLITADIEFASEAASRAFSPPDWLGREITGNRYYANSILARRGGLPPNLSRS